MSDEKIYHTDLYIDVHVDAYLNVTRLGERRWRIGALMQPRQATAAQWWVNDVRLSLTFAGGPSATAIAVAADAGTVTEPRLRQPGDIARQLGYREQTDARVNASSQSMTHARFDFTVDPDVTGMVQLGYLFFSQEFDRELLHDAHKFLTAVPFGTDASGEIVVGTPYQEIWWTDEDIEPGGDAGMLMAPTVRAYPATCVGIRPFSFGNVGIRPIVWAPSRQAHSPGCRSDAAFVGVLAARPRRWTGNLHSTDSATAPRRCSSC